jgi:hypothetical protein
MRRPPDSQSVRARTRALLASQQPEADAALQRLLKYGLSGSKRAAIPARHA